MRAGCASSYAWRNLQDELVDCGQEFTCTLYKYTDDTKSDSAVELVLDTEFETRNDEYSGYKCIVYPSQLDFSNLDLLYVKEEITYSLCDPDTNEVL